MALNNYHSEPEAKHFSDAHLPRFHLSIIQWPRYLRVRGSIEMRSNLVNMQMMHRIYIMIDIQMLIITYTLLIICHYICCTCASLWCILQVHACDEKGLKVKEGEELMEAIAEQFELGTIGLLSTDQHYITQGRNVVEAMTAAEQKTWLHGIHIM